MSDENTDSMPEIPGDSIQPTPPEAAREIENQDAALDAPPAIDGGTRQAHDALVENDRHRRTSRTVTMEKLTDEQIAETRGILRVHTERHNVTVKEVSKKTGLSTATISEFRSASYDGDNQKVARVVAQYLERESRRLETVRPQNWVTTGITEKARSIIGLADRHCAIALIVMPSGTGKTTLAKAMALASNGYYIAANPALNPTELLRSFALMIDHRVKVRTKAEALRFVIEKLRGTNRIIFIDEAHQLGREKLTLIRTVHDEAKVPIVMLGTRAILEYVDDRADGSGQFASRCIQFNAVDAARGGGSEDGDGAPQLFTVEEIQKFFASRELRLAPDAIDFAHRLANLPGFGSLRLITRAAEVAMELKPGLKLIERKHLILALKLQHGSDFVRMDRLARESATPPATIAGAA